MDYFDLHCDTLTECAKQGCGLWENRLHLDVKRGLSFDDYVQVFAIFVPDTLRGEAAIEYGRRLLRLAGRFAAGLPSLCRIHTAADLDTACREHRCGMMLSVESGAVLGGDLSVLDELAAAGVRLLTLTWNGENEWGFGCLDGRQEGLTPFGREALRRMESLHILPDVSHLNEAGFWDVASLTRWPFLATHSLSAAVHPHPRNLTDEQFSCIRDRGGLVGLHLCTDHLGEASFDAFERHLTHFLELDGLHTVAIGCDLDGTALPPDWPGIGTMPLLCEHLERDGFPEAVCDRLFWQNAYDFFHSL